MAYRLDKTDNSLVIDGFENGIATSPYTGIANIQNLNTSYYPGVAYSNYRRQACTFTQTGIFWVAGSHSTNVSNNRGWIFSASVPTYSMTNPVQSAASPSGVNYILDDSGQIWKQTAVNSHTFNYLGSGSGRYASGAGGLAYWNNYLVVFGSGVVEFCGDGSGDSGIISTNWNKTNYGSSINTATITTTYSGAANNIYFLTNYFLWDLPLFAVNDPIRFFTTGTLPAGLSTNTTYYIKSIDYSNAFITVSTTIGGSAVTLTSDGTGVHTIKDFSNPLPLGNCTNFTLTFSGGVVTDTTATISGYVDPSGNSQGASWLQATGLYNIIMPSGQGLATNFTQGSATINFISEILYIERAASYSIRFLDTSVSSYRPYTSKVDGSLYFVNGQFIGRLATSSNTNIPFNPAQPTSYSVSYGVASIPEQFSDTVQYLSDLKSQLVVAGQKDIYTWDYVSAQTSSPAPVGEKIYGMTNLLNNIYILAGVKGNVYVSNGYSAQLLYKLSDFIAGAFDPIWKWGGIMTHRSRLFFQALVQNSSGTNVLAGIFSLIVSPSMIGEAASGLVMEAQNSYGLTPATGALQNGLLIDNQQWSSGEDSYYSAWSNGASTGGIDYNDTSLWQNWEPTIETDIIPIGTILDKRTLGNIQFKLDRPMVTGDQIRIYWRPSLSDSYILMGTTTSAQLSDYFPSSISQAQWAQFKIQMKCASSGSSRIPLREVRISLK